ncbi:MAG: hypothetical protein NVS3B25_16630 [Hymenobacter sp.]
MTPPTKTLWLLALPGLLAAGCHPRGGRADIQQRELMHTGFEELAGWSPTLPPTLTTEKAHSGKYAVRVDPQHPYSATYRVALGELCPTHRPRRLTLRAWVWVPDFRNDAVLVASIANPGDPDRPVFHKSVFLTDSGPFRQWKQVSRDLDLPATIQSGSELVIYLWKSTATEPVYADDLQLTELW